MQNISCKYATTLVVKGETSLWVEEEKGNKVDESGRVIWDKEVAVGAPTLGADLSGSIRGNWGVC